MLGRRGVVWMWLLFVVSSVSSANAQVGAGTLTGIVSDSTGAPVPGATVTVTAPATSRTRVVTSSGDGGYSMPGLSPGLYDVQIELSGFRTVSRGGIRVTTGETVRLDAALSVGAVSEAVMVVGDASQLRPSTSSLGQVIDNQKIVALPLNGRSFVTLAGLVPGVALPPNSVLPRINGGRPRTNEYLFDGISVLQPEPGQVAFFPNIDAIRSSRSRATARLQSSAASTAASST